MIQQANIDPNEINKFNDFAKEWWDPNGPMKPLHQLNPVRLAYIKQHSALSNMQTLDVGCGGGILTESLARENALVTGIDMSNACIKIASQHADEQKLSIHYKLTTIEDFAKEKNESFDVITCMEMLEHVPDPLSIIQTCQKLLKPGGKVFFSTINRQLKAFLLSIIGAEYVLRMLPIGTHDYAKFIRPSELTEWAEQSHLELIDITGMRYHALTQQFSLTEDCSVNYLACYQKPYAK